MSHLVTIPKADICKAEIAQIAQQANLDDLTDRLGLVSTYSDLDMATLKADFIKLVEQLPEDQRFKYQDHKGMTPARYEKGIKFLQDQIAKYKKP